MRRGILEDPWSLWLARGILALFVVMLDSSIVNVARPAIHGDLGLSATGVTWVVNACVLAFGRCCCCGALQLLRRRRRQF